MLIAVGSWPYIRGTLSPSPPGARRSGAPSRIPPRYTSLFSYNDDDGPTVQAATTPLWDRRPTPPPHPPSHIRTCRRNVPLFLRLAPRSLPRARVPAMSRSFFSHVSSPRTLTALRHYAILSLENDGHTDWSSRRPLASASLPAARRRLCPRAFPVRTGEHPDRNST